MALRQKYTASGIKAIPTATSHQMIESDHAVPATNRACLESV